MDSGHFESAFFHVLTRCILKYHVVSCASQVDFVFKIKLTLKNLTFFIFHFFYLPQFELAWPS